jgi:hypothetical protein
MVRSRLGGLLPVAAFVASAVIAWAFLARPSPPAGRSTRLGTGGHGGRIRTLVLPDAILLDSDDR